VWRRGRSRRTGACSRRTPTRRPAPRPRPAVTPGPGGRICGRCTADFGRRAGQRRVHEADTIEPDKKTRSSCFNDWFGGRSVPSWRGGPTPLTVLQRLVCGQLKTPGHGRGGAGPGRQRPLTGLLHRRVGRTGQPGCSARCPPGGGLAHGAGVGGAVGGLVQELEGTSARPQATANAPVRRQGAFGTGLERDRVPSTTRRIRHTVCTMNSVRRRRAQVGPRFELGGGETMDGVIDRPRSS